MTVLLVGGGNAGFWMAGVKAVLPSTLIGTLPVGAFLYMNGEITLPVFHHLCRSLAWVYRTNDEVLLLGRSSSRSSLPIWDRYRSFWQRRNRNGPASRLPCPVVPSPLAMSSFAYDEKEVLHDIRFETIPGAMTAIVGPSGSGKSTIAKLMAGFWDATAGTVSYGGHSLRSTHA